MSEDKSVKINYSIIIPHHDIPRLLERCLASIPKRNDVEVIVVDDNSSPDIVDFSSFPGNRRDDVRLIFSKKERQWAGGARNLGLASARGKWVTFIDADDYFNPCVGTMMDKHKEDDADIVFFRACSLDSELYEANVMTARRTKHIDQYFGEYLNGDKTLGEGHLRYTFGEPWAKLYRRSLLEDNGIVFDIAPINEDTLFAYRAGHAAQKIAADPHCLVCVTARASSLSQSILTDEKKMAIIYIFVEKEHFLATHGKTKYMTGVDYLHYGMMAELLLSGKADLFKRGLNVFRERGLTGAMFYVRVGVLVAKKAIKRILRTLRKDK